jgi:hypothetical protein
MVRFLVVKLIHIVLNLRFVCGCYIFMLNYFLVLGDISVDSSMFLIGFVNLKIKLV